MSSPARTLTALAFVIAACGAPVGTPTHAQSTPAGPTLELAAAPSPFPTVTLRPPPTDAPQPVVRLHKPIPISTSLSLRSGPIDDTVMQNVRDGVEGYLYGLDRYRESGERTWLPFTGRFADAVTAGLDLTRHSGIVREFKLEKITVERYLVKPWGTPALAEVRVTILDRAKDESAPDQRETGKLLLKGGRLQVIDGWDAASGRWFNSDPGSTVTEEMAGNVAHWAVRLYLWVESWVPGSPILGDSAADGDPFTKARASYLRGLDRSKASRLFSEVQAVVEKVEAFPTLPEGLATVRLTGTVTTVDTQGRADASDFERRVVVALLNAHQVVVDEETSPGVWMTGGQLMATLKIHDRAGHG